MNNAYFRYWISNAKGRRLKRFNTSACVGLSIPNDSNRGAAWRQHLVAYTVVTAWYDSYNSWLMKSFTISYYYNITPSFRKKFFITDIFSSALLFLALYPFSWFTISLGFLARLICKGPLWVFSEDLRFLRWFCWIVYISPWELIFH